MGCDIHMYVEYKPRASHDSDWRNGDYFLLDDPLSFTSKINHVALYGERNYPLFAILADVRNYNYLDPIDIPRGLPSDVTDYVKHEYDAWGIDAHSCSYFTLKELIEHHDEECPRDPFGRDILEPLLKELMRRADELHLIWDFEWNNQSTRDAVLDKAAYIRIVFWFDN